MATTVGFIGLGNQGSPIVRHLIDAGFDVVLWARRPEATEPFTARGATAAATPAEMASGCDIVGICVWDDAAVIDVLTGPTGVFAGVREGAIVAIHSTTHPTTCIEMADIAPDNVIILDAPVSGGPDRSAAGTLLTMVGGPAAAVETARPVFDAFSSDVIHLGDLGAGQTAKIINNTLLSANIGMASDAVSVGGRLGLDEGALLRVIQRGSSTSFGADIAAHARGSAAAAAGTAGYLTKDTALIAKLAGEAGITNAGTFLDAAGRGTDELRRLAE